MGQKDCYINVVRVTRCVRLKLFTLSTTPCRKISHTPTDKLV